MKIYLYNIGGFFHSQDDRIFAQSFKTNQDYFCKIFFIILVSFYYDRIYLDPNNRLLSDAKMKENTAYWNSYYENTAKNAAQSKFAEFIIEQHPNHKFLVDVGCGNGRDTLFFAKSNWQVLGIDASAAAISHCINQDLTFDTCSSFLTADITNIDLVSVIKAHQFILNETLIYARFFLHSITAADELTFLEQVAKVVKEGAHFCFEVRTSEDALLPKSEPNHYRRFVIPEELEESCRSFGMVPLYTYVSRGLAPYGTEDPVILRGIFTLDPKHD